MRAWFRAKGWTPSSFQEEAWQAFAAGRSGLVHVPTGAGKTYAAFGGPLGSLIRSQRAGLRVIYLTPLRAVARDIETALARPVHELDLGIRVESRTGDTSSSLRAKQSKSLPQVLVTTPESLCLLLTHPEARGRLGGVEAVIVDEWHELLSSKRGTQVELCLARLRAWNPDVRTWALSATLENIAEAARSVVGIGAEPVIVTADIRRPVEIETLLPRAGERLPWAGHLGMPMLGAVVDSLDPDVSTIVFTNTRSQSERWFHAIAMARPAWADRMGLHHGSIDRDERERIELGLKSGEVGIVVATSSLDLGVDFAPVERVYQIGSPKGIARLLQRAGRSGHRPGETARIICVPTHALEVIEVAAVKQGMRKGAMEPRRSYRKPLDVLAQHMVTCALGGGFDPDELFDEVRRSVAYEDLTREEFDWSLSLVVNGAGVLRAYPQYCKVAFENGRAYVPSARAAQLHRLNVGTIASDATMDIRFATGRRLGSIEEGFISALRTGDTFVFAGKVLQLQGVHDNVAIVRPGRGSTTHTPIWGGTKLPISESLSIEVREALHAAGRGELGGSEGRAAAEFVRLQQRLSQVPAPDEALIELCDTREGSHLFVYPFEGRLVHGGLAAVLAYRISRREPVTLATTSNDYGFELVAPSGFDFERFIESALFDRRGLLDDAIQSVNLSEMAKRQFREIARVAGLVFQTYPGSPRSGRQVQVNSSLIYEVFAEFDPANPLLAQARREVMERQFEESRLARTMDRLKDSKLVIRRTARPTPMGLPLVVERTGARISSESLLDRVKRITEQWEKDASGSKPRAKR